MDLTRKAAAQLLFYSAIAVLLTAFAAPAYLAMESPNDGAPVFQTLLETAAR
jgi:hypothetical protein